MHTSRVHPSLPLTFTLLALALGCGEAEETPSAKAETSEAPTSTSKEADDRKEASSSDNESKSGTHTFVRAPLKIYEQGKLTISLDADGAVTLNGQPAGVFGDNGEYTNSKGEFGMAYQSDGTLLRNDRSPFWGKLNEDGNYVTKSGKWTFDADGTFLINGNQ